MTEQQGEHKGLSSKVLGLKFMQRAAEKKNSQQAQKQLDQQQAQAAAQSEALITEQELPASTDAQKPTVSTATGTSAPRTQPACTIIYTAQPMPVSAPARMRFGFPAAPTPMDADPPKAPPPSSKPQAASNMYTAQQSEPHAPQQPAQLHTASLQQPLIQDSQSGSMRKPPPLQPLAGVTSVPRQQGQAVGDLEMALTLGSHSGKAKGKQGARGAAQASLPHVSMRQLKKQKASS